jgi:hypothetical protein
VAKKPDYQKLFASRLGFAGLGSLWLGPDHLLLVTHTASVERYRRWYLRDIQALIARENSGRLIWNLVFGAAALFLGFGAAGCWFAAWRATDFADATVLNALAVLLGLPALASAGLLLANSLLGPGCTVFIQTIHGVDKISIPGRQRLFRKVLTALQPRLEAIQRTATPTPPGP